jgi:hypothetical protein
MERFENVADSITRVRELPPCLEGYIFRVACGVPMKFCSATATLMDASRASGRAFGIECRAGLSVPIDKPSV